VRQSRQKAQKKNKKAQKAQKGPGYPIMDGWGLFYSGISRSYVKNVRRRAQGGAQSIPIAK
jgi:hypothetical protein